MSEALRAIGGRKSEPGAPSPEALEQMARAQEQLARAKGILQLDRTLTASDRAVSEPSVSSAQIASWIAAEMEGLPSASTPLDPEDFADASGVRRVAAASLARAAGEASESAWAPLEVGSLGDAARDASALEDGGRPVLEILPSVEMSVEAAAGATGAALQSTEIAAPAQGGATRDGLTPGEFLGEEGEPIRTRTMARLLVSHGYLGRALTIYDHLLGQQPDDAELHAEADTARAALAQKTA